MSGWQLWQIVLGAVVIGALFYLLPYLAGVAWSSAFFSRKMKYNREVLKELERSSTDGTEDEK